MPTSLLLAGVSCLAGLILLGYAGTIVYVAHRFTTPRRLPVPLLPVAARASLQRIEFPARHDQHPLAAWYVRAPEAVGAVILVHGRDACRGAELRASTERIAERLTASGLSVLMLDMRGHGESAPSRLTFGRREQRDVLGALDFLLGRGYPRGSVGVLGASMGAASAIAAAADDTAIGALIADSAFADLGDLLRGQFTRLTGLPVACLRSTVLAGRILTGVDVTQHAPERLMLRLRGRPTLVIHAAGDPFVPVSHAHRLAIAGGTTLWVTASERHLGSFNDGVAEYVDVVGRFFARHLLDDRAVPHGTRAAQPRAERHDTAMV